MCGSSAKAKKLKRTVMVSPGSLNDAQAHQGDGPPPLCTENLNPEVMVMEAAEDGARLYASGPLNRANNRRVLVQ